MPEGLPVRVAWLRLIGGGLGTRTSRPSKSESKSDSASSVHDAAAGAAGLVLDSFGSVRVGVGAVTGVSAAWRWARNCPNAERRSVCTTVSVELLLLLATSDFGGQVFAVWLLQVVCAATSNTPCAKLESAESLMLLATIEKCIYTTRTELKLLDLKFRAIERYKTPRRHTFAPAALDRHNIACTQQNRNNNKNARAQRADGRAAKFAHRFSTYHHFMRLVGARHLCGWRGSTGGTARSHAP